MAVLLSRSNAPAAAAALSCIATYGTNTHSSSPCFRPSVKLASFISSSSLINNKNNVIFKPFPSSEQHRRTCSRRFRRDLHVQASAAASSGSTEDVRDFVLTHFSRACAFKVISGLQNFNANNVADIVLAAYKGGATHVDIACDPELVRMAVHLTPLPVCVSSVEPESFLAAVEAGAHMIEIGNYDSFYKSGRLFSASEILELTKKTRRYLPNIVLSVTVPHTLSLDEQVKLAEVLEAEGADIIQTEGGSGSTPLMPGVHGLIEKATPTLAAAYLISKAVKVPVMCASGLSVVTASMAIAAGASGVGVGSAVNKLNDQIAMVAAVRSIADALGLLSRSSRSLSPIAL
ncbi:hypothetical protein O6H91_04G076100 [Diphasiastrum complanatum]|uniref:Uncharacterized protein n=1 Tax=Diphasiastrum complanatum TaxID=34168 RepID=A0ACC2DY48_DIPCM|nr:hypothetical protein O6H91_04G076100 [Diphasiastrum complanatum]